MTTRRHLTQLIGAMSLALPFAALAGTRSMAAEGLTADAAKAWLDAYGKAWETKDSALVLTLFTPDAIYHDSAFEPEMKGADAIKSYWDTVTATQEDIAFQSELWAVVDDVAIAHWSAQFTAGGQQARLDGVFHLKFVSSEAGLVCAHLREWWFYG